MCLWNRWFCGVSSGKNTINNTQKALGALDSRGLLRASWFERASLSRHHENLRFSNDSKPRDRSPPRAFWLFSSHFLPTPHPQNHQFDKLRPSTGCFRRKRGCKIEVRQGRRDESAASFPSRTGLDLQGVTRFVSRIRHPTPGPYNTWTIRSPGRTRRKAGERPALYPWDSHSQL